MWHTHKEFLVVLVITLGFLCDNCNTFLRPRKQTQVCVLHCMMTMPLIDGIQDLFFFLKVSLRIQLPPNENDQAVRR